MFSILYHSHVLKSGLKKLPVCVCVCVCMCCAYVYVFGCLRFCMFVCLCVRACVRGSMCLCVRAREHVPVRVRVPLSVCMYV